MPTYAEYLASLNASLVLALDSTNGLTDLSGNGRDGTGAGGVVVGGHSPGPFDAGATDFDGTDDRITTTYSTRRQGIPNPNFVGAGNWNFSLAAFGAGTGTFTQVADPEGGFFGRVVGTHDGTTGDHQTQLDSSPYNAAPAMPVVPGDTVRIRADLRVPVGGPWAAGVSQVLHLYGMFFNAGGAYLSAFSTSGSVITNYHATNWTTYETQTGTAPAGAAWCKMSCRWRSSVASEAYQYEMRRPIMEKTSTAIGDYFPTAAQLASGEAGWTGTANASASDIGCFANGTTRTFMGWAYRDASADADALFGSDLASGSPIFRLNSGADTVSFFSAAAAAVTWAGPAAGSWFHWALVFVEATDQASFYLNGTLVSTQTMANAWPASATFRIGTRSGLSDPFDGKQAWVSVHERALTPDEILDAAEFSDPTRSGSPLPRTEVRPMSLKADELLADLPPYEADSVWVQDVMDAVGREVERLDEFTEFIREGLRPQNATDQYRLLGMWETLMGLPVEPSGVSLIARQNRVTAAARRRKAGEGEGWVIAISLAIDTYAWTHSENDPGDYQLTVEMPFPSDAFNAGVLEAMLRAVTPAALQITVVYTDSFRVGISLVGDSL
jgi:hypothetical protein